MWPGASMADDAQRRDLAEKVGYGSATTPPGDFAFQNSADANGLGPNSPSSAERSTESSRPSPGYWPATLEVEDRIIMLRKTLTRRGLDAGADTIAAHLATYPVSPMCLLSRRSGEYPCAEASPHRNPTNAPVQLETLRSRAAQPTLASRCHPLAPRERRWRGILNVIDDHSWLAIASLARRTITGPDVTTTFTAALNTWGPPASVLTDIAPS
ncbi:MAG: hypothetical protein QOC62_3354 [Mycobacterium sp.]|jgi:hypothetical protein|nr:hypothetical protein [Mycobacterium sp.]MDT5368923.1 hypothetical protein [Mycobacterium sp.]